MDGNRAVYDISSDEDVAFDFAATEGCDKDVDWKDLFVNLENDAGNNKNCDKGYDSDDVVVVGEVLAKLKRPKKSPDVANLVAQDDDDDDCVVLDGDPDKPEAVEDPGLDSGGDSDDLVIVAEKGQVACRDYPHPRHLCVKFPFDSTQHSDHCKLCHCYVCDSPAPCGNWGDGNLMIDHCHANEKEELWKSERKRGKLEKGASVVSSANTSFWKDLLEQIPAPAPPLAQNSGSHGHFPGQAPSFGLPNIIRIHRAAGFSARPGFHSNLPSRQQINPCSNNSQRARLTGLDSVTTPLKRTRPQARALLPNKASNNSLNGFRHAFSNHFVGMHLASKQINSSLNGLIHAYANAYQDSSATSTSQMSSATIPSQGQVHQYSQPTAYANNGPYMHPNGNQNGNVSAPISSTIPSNTSQSSQVVAGASHIQAEQLPLTEEKPSNGMIPGFPNLEVDTHFLNPLPSFDFEDEHYHMDQLWPLF